MIPPAGSHASSPAKSNPSSAEGLRFLRQYQIPNAMRRMAIPPMTPPTIAPTGVVLVDRFELLLIPGVVVGAAEELDEATEDEEKGTVSIRVDVDRTREEVTVLGTMLLEVVEEVVLEEVVEVGVAQGAKSVATGELRTVGRGMVATTVEVRTLSKRKVDLAPSIRNVVTWKWEGM